MAPAVLGSIAEIDADWLNAVLRAGEGARGQLRLLAVEPVGNGTSSTVARLRLAHGDPSDERPTSLIAKFPRPSAEPRAAAAALGYAVEVAAYRAFGGAPPARIPRCYHAALDDDGRFNLLLEDVGPPCRAGDQIAGCDLADARAVVRQLASLHARFWRSPELERMGWPRRRSALAAIAGERYRRGAAVMRDRYADALGREASAVIQALIPIVEAWNRVEPVRRALIHADARVDNILFEDRPEGVRACLIDLQSIAIWDPAFDLAYFLAGSVDPVLRGDCERQLVAEHSAIMAQADPGYDADIAWVRYRQHAMCGLMGTVGAAGLVAFSPHVDRLLVTLAQRNCAAVTGLDGIAAARDWIAQASGREGR